MKQILIFAILLASQSIASSFDVDIQYEDLNITCYQHKCATIDPLAIPYKFCRCDEDCAKFGECCLDSPYLNQTKEGSRDLYCANVGFKSGVYLINKCPPDWTDKEIIELCQTSDQNAMPEGKDLRGTIIVEGERAVYRNYYCALCHNDVSQPKFWDVGFECPELHPTLIELLSKSVRSYMTYNEEVQKWGVWYRPAGKNDSIFSECAPGYSLRENKLIRNCYRNQISECDENFPDEMIKEKCYRYTANVVDARIQQRYKNPHCAICNNKDIFYGEDCRGIYMVDPPPGGVRSFQILMEFNNKATRRSSKCTDNTVYDDYLKRCRASMCLQGYELKGKTCTPKDQLWRPSFGT